MSFVTRSGRKRVVLCPEVLEDRTVPAGNVTAFVSGGVLHITGDAQANRINVTAFGDDMAIVSTADGDTTVNGTRVPLVFGGIAFSYDIRLNGGNDFIHISNTTGDIAVLVDTGTGDDAVALMFAEHEGATNLHTGTGDDILALGMCELNGFTSMNLGFGDDRADLGGGEYGGLSLISSSGLDSVAVVGVNFTSTPFLFGIDRVYSTHMPLARNDSARVNQNGRATIDVAGNDSANAGTLDLTSVRITEQPEHGTARVNADGTITYIADDDTTAESDSFKYTIRNSLGVESNEATVSLVLRPTPDTTGPTPVITTTATNPTNLATIPFKVTFNEDVTGFVAGDIAVTNGTVGNFVAVNAREFTFNVTPTADGTVGVTIAAGAAEDAEGNDSSAATKTITSDRTQPSVAITSTATSPTNLATIPVTVTFSQAVTGFVAGDVTVTNGAISNFSGSGTTYTFNITPMADGVVTVNVAAGVATDAAGNTNTAAPEFTITSDRTAPTATLATTAGASTTTNPIPFTVVFNEEVTGFTASDVQVTNGSVTNFSGSGTSYSFDVVPNATGNVVVTVPAGAGQDAAGNGNAASLPVTVDFTGTVVTAAITSTATGPTNLATIPVTVQFSEPVTGFDESDLVVTGATITNFQAVDGDTYTFDLGTTAGEDGTITVNIAAGAATGSTSGDPSSAANFSIAFDRAGPTAQITTTAPEPTFLAQIPFTVTFDEDVTGFDQTDLAVTNGLVGNFVAVNARTFTFNVTPTADGAVVVNIAAAAAQDGLGNDSAAATKTVTSIRTDAGMTNTMPAVNAPEWQAIGTQGLKFWDVQVGTGATVVSSSTLRVFYTGWLASNGTEFERSRTTGAPTTFALSGVIQGWQQGLPGMKVGGIRRLLIPAALAYGNNPPPGSGIPPGADLIFEVKLLGLS